MRRLRRRLGKPVKDGKPRPIRIVLSDESIVRLCIKGATNLKTHTTFSRVNILYGRTPRQIDYYKQLKQELNDRTAKGEDSLRIKFVRGFYKVVEVSRINLVYSAIFKYLFLYVERRFASCGKIF